MLESYAAVIREKGFSLTQDALQDELLLGRDGDISIYYAPFDHVNTSARIIVCGITPGLRQAILALRAARDRLLAGASGEEACRAAKKTASFGGPMRVNLIRLLDFVGVPSALGIRSSAELFGGRSDLIHYTSALRYPVFRSFKNYSGAPSMLRQRTLRGHVEKYLLPELSDFCSDTIVIPLGPKVEEALRFAASMGAIEESQILAGLPHPSGANAERIAYFLKEKTRSALSAKTDADKIDTARDTVLAKMKDLCSGRGLK